MDKVVVDDYKEEVHFFPKQYPVTCHTDHVGRGTTFVAIKGFQKDGLAYVSRALERGATTIVVDEQAELSHDLMLRIEQVGACLVRVPNTRKALAHMSARAYGYPAKKLKILAVTGTKGKTTSAYLLAHCLRTLGHNVALLSTVANYINDTKLSTELTTQQPDYLHTFFNVCVKQEVEYVVMEVAAQAQTLHRTDEIEFDGILFTNFAQEHAEFYATQEEYFKAKASLFSQAKPDAPCLVNADDDSYDTLRTEYAHIQAYSCKKQDAEYRALIPDETTCEVATTFMHGDHKVAISCEALFGQFNVYNVTGVMSLLVSLGFSDALIAQAMSTFTGVPGRLERHQLPNGAQCFIDYAHNPSSFEAVLSTLSSLTDHLIVVFGAGGDRDQVKRPLMGAVAARYAQCVLLTTDNPRSEDPYAIITDIKCGIDEDACTVIQELDRQRAIHRAYELSHKGSIIAVLGKGPDEYQLVDGVKTFFSDAKVVMSLT